MRVPLRILYTSNSYPPDFIGGAELVAHRHAQHLAGLGARVEVFAGDRAGKRPVFSVHDDNFEGLRVHRVAIGPAQCDPRRLNILNRGVDRAFVELLREFRPDVVHLHNTVGLSLGMIHHARRSGASVILTAHDHWGFCLRNTLLKWDQELCADYTRCEDCLPFVWDEAGRRIPISCRSDYASHRLDELDLLISPSRYLGGRYVAAGFPSERVRHLDYGVDLQRFGMIERTLSRVVRFSFIGYLGEHKGVLVLLKALELLPAELDWRLNLVGAGHLETAIRHWCVSHEAGRRVRFLGKVEAHRIEEVYRETDVFVLPSIWPENQPVTILEAMSSGLPIIASRLGGVPEIVEDGVTGWTFDPQDVGALVRCLERCIRHPDLCVQRGLAGRRRVMASPLLGQAARLLDIYRELGARAQKIPVRRKVVAVSGPAHGRELRAMVDLIRDPLPNTRVFPLEWLEPTDFGSVTAIVATPGAALPRMGERAWSPAVPMISLRFFAPASDGSGEADGFFSCRTEKEALELLRTLREPIASGGRTGSTLAPRLA